MLDKDVNCRNNHHKTYTDIPGHGFSKDKNADCHGCERFKGSKRGTTLVLSMFFIAMTRVTLLIVVGMKPNNNR